MGCGCKDKAKTTARTSAQRGQSYTVTAEDGTVTEFDDYQAARRFSRSVGSPVTVKR